jgi:hypothetical protein
MLHNINHTVPTPVNTALQPFTRGFSPGQIEFQKRRLNGRSTKSGGSSVNAAVQLRLSPQVKPDRYSEKWFYKQIESARSLGPVLRSLWQWNCKKPIRNYKGVFPEQGQMAVANAELRKAVSTLRRMDLNLASSDEEIRDWSKAKARQFEKWVHDCSAPIQKAVMMLEPYGLSMPKVERPKEKDAYRRQVSRLCCPKWWRRQVRVLCQRHCEGLLRDLGETRKQRGIYVSDYTVRRVLQSKQRNRSLLEGMEAENDLGQVFNLGDLSDKGISNPGIRRGELMTRIRGFEEWVNGNQPDAWRCMFYTITCPSRFHPWYRRGGKNSSYDGSDPVAGQKYLCDTWAKIRSEWAREDIKAFGFRVAEPHHDGTPHWHLMLFVPAQLSKKATLIMRDYACAVDPGELKNPKARRARFTAVKIDPSKGTASGYIAKYISKNIDGYKVDVDFEAGASAAGTAIRVMAWASVWGIRQFQQIGGPPVTVWREARRLACNPAQMPKEGQLPLLVEQIIDSADRGQWAQFVDFMGGAVLPRVLRPMKPFYLISQKMGQYGERVKQIKGVTVASFIFPLVSRPRKWVVRHIQTAADCVAEMVAASPPLDLCQ